MPDRRVGWRLAAAALLILVLWIDTRTPPGLAVPALYAAPVLIFLLIGRYWESIVVAAIATVLTVAGSFASPSDAGVESAPANRALAVGLVWISALLVAWHRRATARWTDAEASARLQARESVTRLEEIRDALDQAAIVAATDQHG